MPSILCIFSPVQSFDLHRVGHMSQRLVCVQVMIDRGALGITVYVNKQEIDDKEMSPL